MRAARLALAALCAIAAVAAAIGAHDLLAWRSSFAHNDSTLVQRPERARWSPSTWLPGDPARALLALGDDVAARRAIKAFDVARSTGRGFDFGESQAVARSAAEVRLSDVAAGPSPTAASQAGNLLGVLVAGAGRVAGGVTADARAQDAFSASVRRDTSNLDAKYNLELLLRRTKATSTRHGAGTGAGSRGRGRRGAGAGTPGRGY